MKPYALLRDRMKAKKITQQDIADHLNKSRRHIVNCFNGSSCFSETDMYEIAELLELDDIGRYFNECQRNGIANNQGNRRLYRLKSYELADALIYKGMGAPEIAVESGLAPMTIRRMLRGEWIRVDCAELFADYLGMSREELFYERRYIDVKVPN